MTNKRSKELDHVSLNLRLPHTLHKRLSKEATNGRRSLNAEILLRLQDSFNERQADLWVEFKTNTTAQIGELRADLTAQLKQLQARADESIRDSECALAECEELKRRFEQIERNK
jgi:hypothetical protein